MVLTRLSAALLLLALASPVCADETAPPADFAIVGARVITAAGDDVPDGVVVVKKGRIEAVGPRADVVIPKGVETIDASGKVLMPSFVHAASRIGLRGNGSGGDTGTALHDLDPWNPANRYAAGSGFATLGLLPGRGIVGGEGVAVRTAAEDVDTMLRSEHAFLRVTAEPGPRFAKTLGGKLAAARKELDATEKWKKAHAKWEKDKAAAEKAKKDAPKEPAEPKSKEDAAAFRRVLEGETALLCEISDAADASALTAALADERVRGEKLRLYALLSGDAYNAAAELADLGATCVIRVGTASWPGTDLTICPAVMLRNAGLRVVLLPWNDSRDGLRSFPHYLAVTAEAGFGSRDALRAATVGPATMLGMGEDCGTVETGRRADLQLYSGDPLLPTTRLLRTWIDGVTVEETP